jgi:small conductance mechanosensitive channel
VSGIHVDVTDTTSAWVTVKGWVMSQEGGVRWLVNIASFVGILILAWFLAKLLSRVMHKAMTRVSLPKLLEDFLVRSVRWVVMGIGIIWALAALEVSVGPLLALVGAAGFILAFAMQDSLSNFASGLMILFFRPFDTGDVVDAGGVSGTVRSMNLVSTTIRTFDNKLMVVPNSKIWSDVITNVTGVTQRRVDMEFGIGYSDDIDLAQQILEEIVAAHPKVLKDPAPVIKMSALADSSVNFICRPWASPADYWDVYWDVTREVKKRFDAAGIGIPFPQRDVHLYIEKDGAADRAAALRQGEVAARKPAGPEGPHADGGMDTTGAGV